MTCKVCHGVGAVRGTEPDGRMGFVNCTCQTHPETQVEWLMRQARIPELYRHAEIENYETSFPSCTQMQKGARIMAQKYVDEFPLLSRATGLAFCGKIGTGKTHLMAGILKQLVRRYSVKCLYQDNQALLRVLQSAHDREDISEWGVLKPILNCHVLALDDLGVFKMSDWRLEMMYYIVNERYNNSRHTIVATNFDFHRGGEDNNIESENPRSTKLGDRIGIRTFDRLSEMCLPVIVNGESMRQGVKMARMDTQ